MVIGEVADAEVLVLVLANLKVGWDGLVLAI